MIDRNKIYNKFNGKCAYTGLPLNDDWEIDHVTPKIYYEYNFTKRHDMDDEKNLIPAIKIVNHYKRGKDLEAFREYMLTFHERLKKLPKNPKVKRSINRKKYMYRIAALFGITVDKPFDGIFYFEKLNN